MIKGFEEQTAELTEYEKRVLLPAVVDILKTQTGKKRSILNYQISNRYELRGGTKINPARIRKLINYIRTRGIIAGLIATSKGYYIATTRDELREYCDSLEQRIAAIEHVRNAIIRDIDTFTKRDEQLNLFE